MINCFSLVFFFCIIYIQNYVNLRNFTSYCSSKLSDLPIMIELIIDNYITLF